MFAKMLPVHATGGMEIHTLDLAGGIADAGHNVVLITSRHPRGVEEEDICGVEVHYVDADNQNPLGRESTKKLVELDGERRFDVIHSQSISAFYYVKDKLSDRLKIPLVTTMHGTSYGEIRSILNQGLTTLLVPRIARQLYNHHFRTNRILQASDKVIAISRELTESIPREYHISRDKVRTIYNGIDTERFKPGESRLRGRFPGKRIVLSVSVLHKQKGVQNLIKAFGKVAENVPGAHLIVVGDGPYRRNLEGLARNQGLKDDVTFTGKVPNTELREYYNACDSFVIPTVRVEGLPLIELEAMACGKPVIASDIGGIPTVIENMVNGLLVKPGDVDELAKRIVEVLGDSRLASRLGTRARKTIEDGFSRRKMVEETIKVYESVLR
jgi:glycosyltransferase involved in cell wall biosynthesis